MRLVNWVLALGVVARRFVRLRPRDEQPARRRSRADQYVFYCIRGAVTAAISIRPRRMQLMRRRSPTPFTSRFIAFTI